MSAGTIIIKLAASGVIALWIVACVGVASWITAGAIQSRKDRRDEFANGDWPNVPKINPVHPDTYKPEA